MDEYEDIHSCYWRCISSDALFIQIVPRMILSFASMKERDIFLIAQLQEETEIAALQ
jgi:hypothetical protein